VAKFKGGVEAAAKMLAGLDPKDRERVLADIIKRDPSMAEALKEAMVTFEDLIHISVKQLQELLREIKVADLALGLRVASKELRAHFYGTLPKSMRQEIDEVLLGPVRPLEKVLEAQEAVMSVVRSKIDKGEIVLSRTDEPMV
tara:strand:- start:53729 stop:54157 length:429 start_codon:yes stop_codon:yes gene_type:complete